MAMGKGRSSSKHTPAGKRVSHGGGYGSLKVREKRPENVPRFGQRAPALSQLGASTLATMSPAKAVATCLLSRRSSTPQGSSLVSLEIAKPLRVRDLVQGQEGEIAQC